MSTADCPEEPYNNLSYRRNLQTEIAALYGRDIAKETRRLEATRITTCPDDGSRFGIETLT